MVTEREGGQYNPSDIRMLLELYKKWLKKNYDNSSSPLLRALYDMPTKSIDNIKSNFNGVVLEHISTKYYEWLYGINNGEIADAIKKWFCEFMPSDALSIFNKNLAESCWNRNANNYVELIDTVNFSPYHLILRAFPWGIRNHHFWELYNSEWKEFLRRKITS